MTSPVTEAEIDALEQSLSLDRTFSESPSRKQMQDRLFDILEEEAEPAEKRLVELRQKVNRMARKTPAMIRSANRAQKQALAAKKTYVFPSARRSGSGLSAAASAEKAIKDVLEARSKLVEETARGIARRTHKAPKAKQLPKIALPISKDRHVKKAAKTLIKDDIRAAKAKVKALEHELVAMKPKCYLPRDPVKKVNKLRRMLAKAESSLAARQGM